MRWWAVAGLFLCGCGRLGYDPLAADAAPAAHDDCATLPRLDRPPALDGLLEPGLVPAAIEPVGWSGAQPIPAAERAESAAAWFDDGLYFFVDVTDPDRLPAADSDEPWCGDGVEIYVDSDGAYTRAPAYDDPGARQLIARAPSDDSTPRSSGGGVYVSGRPARAWQMGYVAAPRAGGFTFEAVVSADVLGLTDWSLAAGARVGMDVSVNVSYPDATVHPNINCARNHRLGQFFLHIDPDPGPDCLAPWCNADAFCTARLED